MQNPLMQQAESVAAKLKILSHPKRLILLCLMTEAERNVGELAARSGMREAAVSQQLMLLRKDGVVNVRREGQMMFYHLADADMAAILTFLHARFCPAEAAETAISKPKRKWLS